jgi:hypothetical protein
MYKFSLLILKLFVFSAESNRKLLTQYGLPSLLLKLLPKIKNQRLQETARTSIANLLNDGNKLSQN